MKSAVYMKLNKKFLTNVAFFVGGIVLACFPSEKPAEHPVVKQNLALDDARKQIQSYDKFVSNGRLITVYDPRDNMEVDCLALNNYHEARGEGYEGMLAVSQVVMAREASPRWPNTVCDVVYQKSQFSWTDDEHTDQVKDYEAWSVALAAARAVYFDTIDTPLAYADHYHRVGHKQNVSWAAKMDKVAVIGNHVFFNSEG